VKDYPKGRLHVVDPTQYLGTKALGEADRT
jgi:hypothetical protein